MEFDGEIKLMKRLLRELKNEILFHSEKNDYGMYKTFPAYRMRDDNLTNV